MSVYRLFTTIQGAKDAVEKIDCAMNCTGTDESWSAPIEHPYRDEALVSYWPEMLNEEAFLAFANTEEIDLSEAAKREFYIGSFPGRFGKSRAKLEESQLLFEALIEQKSKTNQPVTRALFFAYLSTLYALRESLKKVCMAKGDPLKSWWKARQAELDKPGELLPYLLFVVNRDKHNASAYLAYSITTASVNFSDREVPKGTSAFQISTEGIFAMANAGTPKFRRIPLGKMEGQFTVYLVGAPSLHLGQPVAGSDLFVACQVALEYFEQAVFDAENLEKERLAATKLEQISLTPRGI